MQSCMNLANTHTERFNSHVLDALDQPLGQYSFNGPDIAYDVRYLAAGDTSPSRLSTLHETCTL